MYSIRIPLTINTTPFVSFICFILLISCDDNRVVDLESHFNEIIAKSKTQEWVSLKMDTIASFEWDSLLVAGPYSQLEEISKKEGIELTKIPNTIQHNDSFILIIFLNNNEGIKWMELDHAQTLEHLLCDGKGYCIYPKTQSNFSLKTKGQT